MFINVHQICVKSQEGEIMFSMDDFSSSRFSNLYLKVPFASMVRFNMLDYTTRFFDLQKWIDEIVEYINDNGGFTVVGGINVVELMIFQMIQVKTRSRQVRLDTILCQFVPIIKLLWIMMILRSWNLIWWQIRRMKK